MFARDFFGCRTQVNRNSGMDNRCFSLYFPPFPKDCQESVPSPFGWIKAYVMVPRELRFTGDFFGCNMLETMKPVGSSSAAL